MRKLIKLAKGFQQTKNFMHSRLPSRGDLLLRIDESILWMTVRRGGLERRKQDELEPNRSAPQHIFINLSIASYLSVLSGAVRCESITQQLSHHQFSDECSQFNRNWWHLSPCDSEHCVRLLQPCLSSPAAP